MFDFKQKNNNIVIMMVFLSKKSFQTIGYFFHHETNWSTLLKSIFQRRQYGSVDFYYGWKIYEERFSIFQRRQDGPVDFYRGWKIFEAGFQYSIY